MKKENEASRATGNTTDVAILTKAPVSLHSSQSDVISYFKKNPNKYISTFEFRKNGISNPAQRISEIIMLGAIIKKNFAPAIDESGKEHKKVAWYLFKGWEV